jgi:transposase-like protein
MATKIRRSFTDEFKREAVSLLTSSGRPLTQVARELGIQPSLQMLQWITRRRQGSQPIFRIEETPIAPPSLPPPSETRSESFNRHAATGFRGVRRTPTSGP